jgi:alkanesulfonate monooxygenase SsuD/methylene tetrahydromethanopterin reductase-like flavin-dependent oxidoreductase (luciferase family)
LQRLWAEDKVTHHGRHYRFDNVTLGLARPPRPPAVFVAQGIYLPHEYGGPSHHEWEARRAGRYVLGPPARVAARADGWLTCHPTPDEYARARTRLTAARPLGAAPLRQAFNCFVNVNPDRAAGWRAIQEHLLAFHGPPVPDDIVDRWAVTGSGAEIVAQLQPYVEQGATVFQFVIGARDQRGQMRALAREVLPALRAVLAAANPAGSVGGAP